MRVLFNIGHKDTTPQTFALLLSFGFLIRLLLSQVSSQETSQKMSFIILLHVFTRRPREIRKVNNYVKDRGKSSYTCALPITPLVRRPEQAMHRN